MKKYKVVKWLVLFTAIFAVACFFTPFIYCNVGKNGYGGINQSDWNSGGSGALYYGFHLISGMFGRYENYTLHNVAVLGQIIACVSLLISIGAVIFAFLPFILKNANGLNKKNKFHKSLIVSIAFSVLSALINLISMLVINSIGSYTLTKYSGTGTIETNIFYDIYTYIGLIPIVIVAIIVIILCVKLKPEIAHIKDAQQPESTVENKVIENAAIPTVGQPEIIKSESSAAIVNESSTMNKTVASTVEQPKNSVQMQAITDYEGTYSDNGKTLSKVKGKRSIFTIPEGVTTIARDAFLGYNALKELVIPSSVKNIGICAFPYNLKTIYFQGTKADWEKINKDKDISEISVFFYSETKPTLFSNFWRYASDGITPEITGISINNVWNLIILRSKER